MKAWNKLKKRKLILYSGCLISAATIIPVATSCSHVFAGNNFIQGETTINQDRTRINLDRPLPPTNGMDNLTKIWNDINDYKEMIIQNKIFNNTALTKEDITIPYSSIMIKDESSFKIVTMQAYLRTFNFNGRNINKPDTNFPQHSYDTLTYRIQVTPAKFQDLRLKIGDKKHLAQFIVDYQTNNTFSLFDSIPSRIDVKDFDIGEATLEENDKQIFIPFTLKSLYNKGGKKEETFKLEISSGDASFYQQSISTTKQSLTTSSLARQNDSRFWINKDECSAAVAFIFQKQN